VRCGRCGNENAEGNRFCGMCGTSLVAIAQDAGQSSARAPAAAVPVQPIPTPRVPRPAVQAPLPGPVGFDSATAERRPVAPRSFESKPFETKSSSVPVSTGPSFLGLSTPGPATDRHAERDPLRPSSNLDYLLDDEEEPKRGWGKPILVLVALVLAVGFGYLHWQQGGFDWLNSGDKKPAAAQPTATPSGTDSGSVPAAATQGAAPAADSGSGGTAPATNLAAPGSAESPAGQAIAPPGTSQPASQNTAQAAPAQSAPSQTTSSQATPSQTTPSDPNLPASAAPQTAGSDATTQAPSEEPKAPARKPSAAKPAARPVDTVTEAQRYVYGRGVRQDCDQGVRMLKAAAQQSNAKAMISMGALYSTGTCTPRDLPTAYRWFALALHKDPDNQALQDDLQKLWSQMTQPERQLAIKLSQ
jgi:hypothetical protein